MKKKILTVITTILVLCMCFSTVAFASEESADAKLKIVNDAQSYFSEQLEPEGIQGRAAAPAISNATITNILQDDTNNHVYAIVSVTGYGYAYGFIDGMKVTLSDSATVGKPVVTGFVYLFDCGVLSSGSHTFRYSGTSYNSPWNTVNRQVTFMVP